MTTTSSRTTQARAGPVLPWGPCWELPPWPACPWETVHHRVIVRSGLHEPNPTLECRIPLMTNPLDNELQLQHTARLFPLLNDTEICPGCFSGSYGENTLWVDCAEVILGPGDATTGENQPNAVQRNSVFLGLTGPSRIPHVTPCLPACKMCCHPGGTTFPLLKICVLPMLILMPACSQNRRSGQKNLRRELGW